MVPARFGVAAPSPPVVMCTSPQVAPWDARSHGAEIGGTEDGQRNAAPKPGGGTRRAWFSTTRRTVVQLLLSCASCLALMPREVAADASTRKSAEWSPWHAALDDGIPVSTYAVTRRVEHDPRAFTQGLEFDADGRLVESTGLYGKSQLRRVLVDDTSKVVQQKAVGKKYFGEGMTIIGDYIVQLTWKEKIAFVYDKTTFKRAGSFRYPYDGWGLARSGKTGLITTDGTNVLRFWERAGASDQDARRQDSWWRETEAKELQMSDGRLVKNVLWRPPDGNTVQLAVRLNELENVGGEVWANLWPTETIVRIDPKTAVIKGWIDMRGLRDEAQALAIRNGGNIDVLNGIAYRAATDALPKALVVTGKWWPRAFHVDIVAPSTTRSEPAPPPPFSSTAPVSGEEDTCAWADFAEGGSGVAEVVAATPSAMSHVPVIDFGF